MRGTTPWMRGSVVRIALVVSLAALPCGAGCGLVLDARPHEDAGRAVGMDASVTPDAAADALQTDATSPDARAVEPEDTGMEPPDAFAIPLDAPLPETSSLPDAPLPDAPLPDAGCGPCVPEGPCDTARCEGATCLHTPRPAGDLCRSPAAPCEGNATCNGIDSACPTNPLVRGVVCRVATGACDLPEVCDGSGAACPPDRVQPSDRVCRPGATCDAPERCDGTHPDCPADTFGVDWNGVCERVPGVCTARTCATSTSCSEGAPCQRGCTLGTISCASGTPMCLPAGVAPVGTICRAALGPCDVEERCDGVGTACPADVRRPPDFVCRPAAGPCDVEELCGTVAGVVCPTDVLAAATRTCDAVGCRRCSGTSPDCSELRPATSACPGGHCDVVGRCVADGAPCLLDAPECSLGTWSSGMCSVGPVVPTAPDGQVCEVGAGQCLLDSVCMGGLCTAPPVAVGRACLLFCVGRGYVAGTCTASGDCTGTCPTG